ncbi:MAG TPA: hypothetical protein VK993_11470 [Chthoniobacterales bacterium]|nr:hypothetical protein [Chthoniobacterales bacterium]
MTLLPRSHGWTPKQRWLIAGCGALALAVLGGFVFRSAVWVRTDLEPLPEVTQVEVLGYEGWRGSSAPAPLESSKLPALTAFIDEQRSGWTGGFLGTFELPHPVLRADLYEGDRYIGYFAVGGGILPGSHAVFEVRRGNVRARKRVAVSAANRFLDLIGEGGELINTPFSATMQGTARQRATDDQQDGRARAIARSTSRPVKFHPGDRVRVKATQTEGKVCLRTRLFREDRYFVTFPGSYDVREPIRERERSAGQRVAYEPQYGYWYSPRPWHEEGPFHESELELAR